MYYLNPNIIFLTCFFILQQSTTIAPGTQLNDITENIPATENSYMLVKVSQVPKSPSNSNNARAKPATITCQWVAS